jgi:hypothetical protein
MTFNFRTAEINKSDLKLSLCEQNSVFAASIILFDGKVRQSCRKLVPFASTQVVIDGKHACLYIDRVLNRSGEQGTVSLEQGNTHLPLLCLRLRFHLEFIKAET